MILRFARSLAVARLLLVGALLGAAQLGASRLGAQAPGARERARFEITSVGDSTFTFAVGARTWVSARDHGDAVDPRRRGQLVARFEVLRVTRGVATALITAETARVTTLHVALIDEPRHAFYRRGTFWSGVIAGAAAGVGVMAAIR